MTSASGARVVGDSIDLPRFSAVRGERLFEVARARAYDSAVVALEWENLRVPFRVGVDTHAIVQASLKKQLRGQKRYIWMSWDDAANYLLHEKLSLDDALLYANKSIELEDRFDNELTKAKVLSALNRPADSETARRHAIDLGDAAQLRDYAVDLLKTDRNTAFAVIRENARRHPEAWQAHEGLARMYFAQGKSAQALKEAQTALASAPASERSGLEELAAQLATASGS